MMRHKWRVLVVEDDPDMREMLRLTLSARGFDIITASDAAVGLRLAYQTRPDAIILDVVMPEMDGFEACRRLREMTAAPILFLSGKASDVADIVKGFGLGADEYMIKPIEPAELVSRLNACLRRAETGPNSEARYLYPTPSVMLDCERHELTVNGQRIYLRPKEFQVLEILIRHSGRVLSSDAILYQVWGPDRIGDPGLVRQYVHQLRKKIEADPQEPNYIQSVPGGGYYFSGTDPI